MKSARVFLVDDHAIVRQGFRSLLAGDNDVEVVGEASSGEEAIELLGRTRADIVVMDVHMKGLDGLMTARRLLRRHPGLKILVLSMYEDTATVRQAIQIGVAGYVVKSTDTAELLRAIREIARGNAYFSPSLQRMLAELSATSPPATVELTVRDQELLRLIGAGKSNKEIAAMLCIGVKTVEKYRQHLMNKIDIHDVAGLTRYAIEKGILKLK
jgi:DNA-binding NarL/FixJ family response regulator